MPETTEKTCECGCGLPAPIAKRNNRHNRRYGHVKGQPVRFVQGHTTKRNDPEWVAEDRGYKTPCHIWQRSLDRHGYAQRKVGGRKGKNVRVHRQRWIAKFGPTEFQLDHRCRVRACVNEDHLEPVTLAENCRRGAQAKLTYEKVEVIRAMLVGGHRPAHLARLFGVAPSTISNIKARRIWAT